MIPILRTQGQPQPTISSSAPGQPPSLNRSNLLPPSFTPRPPGAHSQAPMHACLDKSKDGAGTLVHDGEGMQVQAHADAESGVGCV